MVRQPTPQLSLRKPMQALSAGGTILLAPQEQGGVPGRGLSPRIWDFSIVVTVAGLIFDLIFGFC